MSSRDLLLAVRILRGRPRLLSFYSDDPSDLNSYANHKYEYDQSTANEYWDRGALESVWWRGLDGSDCLCGAVCLHVL